MFFHFHQNNTFGKFIEDESKGIGSDVIIEADSASEANSRALSIGIYFDGCASGDDCPCCGDRWSRVDEYEATEKPEIYGGTISELRKSSYRKEVFVHYKDGTFSRFELAE
jgi:hypothetical protein